ncbi:DUF4349 domain-containing protein [Neobacillus kokaensis]|uniref:DUF4349 domain-containing protein n=1 Tax=Neobacillus kokaensis TaxID=2759023 RepID=A0ABQ3NBU2_9BACI|nr:DUF4349 domain-containing protein [Neobacillus kokaensis]GHI01402.1 hypothetical protein AM1BK_49440 [Neobacillus kokaensis]
MNKLKKILFFMFLTLLIAMAGCSSSNSKESQDSMDSAKSMAGDSTGLVSKNEDRAVVENKTEASKIPQQTKMVIYHADLRLRVKKFEQTVRNIEEMAAKYGGYIAESNITREGKEQLSGMITIRIPQKHFQDFLDDAEGKAAEVLQRNITGQDVTEEYVDLQSRLKSKRVVEERLLSFMKNATKTEDLLKISNDLAVVQEEIETIEGKIKYLENQTSYSTVTLTLYENQVIVPDIGDDQLNTWEKTKKQFMKSTNLLLTGISSLVVFIFGNLPILVILLLIGGIIYYSYKRNKNSNNQR